ncbi:MAG: hypothetical protein KUG57_01690 [Ilumatobacteraceae bacterium]|nr:hypothetical protein [Ilumatobacteraceae bacterium]
MRRSPAGLLLIVAGVLIALAVSTWWFQRVAFSPSSDSNKTLSILGDEDIRSEIATIVAGADAAQLSQSPTQLKEFIEGIAQLPDGAALMSEFVGNAHARLIGDREATVEITAAEQVTIVRDERVGELAVITLPVEEVGSLSFIDSGAKWLSLASLALGIILLVAGLVLNAERGEFTFALGVTMATLAGLLVLLGYLVPLAGLPALSDDTWMGVFPRLANHDRNLTLALAIGALIIGAVATFGTNDRRRRRQTSTPMSAGRYRVDRSWSR